MKNPLSWRYRMIHITLAVMGLAIIVRIIAIQNSPEGITLVKNGITYTGSWRTYYPARGEIYDRDGHLLAGNQTVYEIGVDLKLLPDANAIALATQVYLGLDYAKTYEQITQPEPGVVYVVLADFIPADKVDKLAELQKKIKGTPDGQNLSALNFTAHLERSYPEKTLAANVLGFVSREGRGYFGVEEKYNSLLAGVPVTMWVSADPNRAEEMPHIPPGETLILTINREIQAGTEEILDKSIQTYGAESGTIIVMDPKTGEILAMATTPRMNPNEYWKYSDVFPGESPYNRAISQAYEPGSVFKILTMAAAVDKGSVTQEISFLDTGQFTFGGSTIHNWDGKSYGPQNMIGCLQHSLNVCLAWVATQLGNQDFYSYMQHFGLGHPTGIDLAGESSGRLKLPGDTDWYPVDLATNAFGQGVSVTPIQMIMAASAITNGGQMIYPHVLYATVQDGRQHNLRPQIIGQPITPVTANTLDNMLSVSLKNESSLALIPGYQIAGKTGTAEIPTQYGYGNNQTNASFIGWGPVDDPRFMVYVWLEKPSASIWGSETAAPVFKQIVQKLIVLMGIPPDLVRLSQKTGQ